MTIEIGRELAAAIVCTPVATVSALIVRDLLVNAFVERLRSRRRRLARGRDDGEA